MKAKLWPMLLMSPLLLASCSNQNGIGEYKKIVESINEYLSPEEADAFVEQMPEITYAKFSYESEINLFGVEDEKEGRKMDLIEDAKSKIIRAPMVLDEENFYIVNEKGNLDPNCQYYLLKSRLVHSNPGKDIDVSIGTTKENHIIFYVHNSNNKITFYQGDENGEDVSFVAKYDLAFEYDEYGYLIKESFYTCNYNDAVSRKVTLNTTYTYAN